MKRRKKGRHLIATNLARKIWRTEGACEYCGAPAHEKQMQGAHIYGVGAYPRLRDDLRNGLCLCSEDHRMFTDNPMKFTDWIRTTKYADYETALAKKNLTFVKRDWDERNKELRYYLKAIESGELTLDEIREIEDNQ